MGNKGPPGATDDLERFRLHQEIHSLKWASPYDARLERLPAGQRAYLLDVQLPNSHHEHTFQPVALQAWVTGLEIFTNAIPYSLADGSANDVRTFSFFRAAIYGLNLRRLPGQTTALDL